LIPAYKIETYDRITSALDNTITADALHIKTRDTVTDGVGTFEFTLPYKVGTNYVYTDIAVGDAVKIYLDWDSIAIADTPQMVGKICRIDPTPSPTGGYIRSFTGKTLGWTLEQQRCTRLAYVNTDADVIVDAVCAAATPTLSNARRQADGTHITLDFDHETYYDILRKVADFYCTGGVDQVKSDFYVDAGDVGHPNGHLVWGARGGGGVGNPFRTTGVETLTLGDNILGYTLITDGNSVKNSVNTYGKKNAPNPKDPSVQGRKYPTDGDSWTYGVGWTGVGGTAVATCAVAPQVGASCTRGTNGGAAIEYYRTFNQTWVEGLDGYGTLDFWLRAISAPMASEDVVVKLFCPDSTNYYSTTINLSTFGGWWFYSFSLGDNNVYSATTNPNGQWTSTVSPSWDNIQGVDFYTSAASNPTHLDVDGLCFNYARWTSGAVTNAGSITKYGVRQLDVVDDEIDSDANCTKRSESVLRQKMTETGRLDIQTSGNTNLLLGDTLTMTLAPEGISATPFYIMTVAHEFTKEPLAWNTTVSMLDTLDTRLPPPSSEREIIRQHVRMRERGAGGDWYRGG